MDAVKRLRLTVQGAVQGVGFRPFVYQLAQSLELTGWVNNSAQGVSIEVEGSADRLEQFLTRFPAEKPPLSSIQSLESVWLEPGGHQTFEIRPSVAGERTALVLPDVATCADCLQEIQDPTNRRYRYPFTNCTHCGPRYSLIEALPYDRANTSMKIFPMCADCQAEYENPLDRRFHAQPNACQNCGPQVALWDGNGQELVSSRDAIAATATAIHQGQIVAVKGLGGFHLMVDARNDRAVQTLRQRKRRPDKPFALMYPDLAQVQADCQVSPLEAELLRSREAPIVLLRKRKEVQTAIAPVVAPGNPYLGAMLPYTPLHHLLLAELDCAIVATSGNLANEPICTDEQEALERLQGIADCFLVHNRPIVRPIDDSVVRIMAGSATLLRRARGYAPLPVAKLPAERARQMPILAVGAHLKNAIALGLKQQIFLSQHIGDLGTPQAAAAFEQTRDSLQQLYDFHPQTITCDAHPDYLSSQYARASTLPCITVQHHQAHVLASLVEHHLWDVPVLGVAWDGTGYGLDGTIWGGEWFRVDPSQSGLPQLERVACWRPFPLPGGDRAAKEPRRVALGWLYAGLGEDLFADPRCQSWLQQAFSPQEQRLLAKSLAQAINAPLTSSVGRLFDATAAIAGLCQIASFEAQAAMQLEFAATEIETEDAYPFGIRNSEFGIRNSDSFPSPYHPIAPSSLGKHTGLPLTHHPIISGQTHGFAPTPSHPIPHTPHPTPQIILDWQPLLLALLEDLQQDCPIDRIAAKFHNALIDAIAAIAQKMEVECVVLTGGCFQNRLLAEEAMQRLQALGFQPYLPRLVPPNDGGIACGQAAAALLASE